VGAGFVGPGFVGPGFVGWGLVGRILLLRSIGALMAFLLIAVVGSIVGITIVLLRNRRPNSMEHSIDEFERNLRALAPETPSRRKRRSE
jgi:hypothetical protein